MPAARDLGLAANPAVLQHLSVVFESANPTVVRRFWRRVLDYAPGEDGGLADPLRRDPAIRIRQSTEPRPLRNRIHLDLVRPAAAVEQASLGEASGPFGVCHTDPDGNEVDLVPGAALDERIGTADWQAVFSAMACYRTTSPTQQRDLAAAAAALADDTGCQGPPRSAHWRPADLPTGGHQFCPVVATKLPSIVPGLAMVPHVSGVTP